MYSSTFSRWVHLTILVRSLVLSGLSERQGTLLKKTPLPPMLRQETLAQLVKHINVAVTAWAFMVTKQEDNSRAVTTQ
ncbi:hypothetical protein BDW67DRAFT_154998, partial [Aspergillus spinulosporus]